MMGNISQDYNVADSGRVVAEDSSEVAAGDAQNDLPTQDQTISLQILVDNDKKKLYNNNLYLK